MTGKERAQMYSDYLQGEGYVPQTDGDGHVLFKAEGRTYVVVIDDRDEIFFRIVFPNFWPIENDGERQKAQKAALEATADTKVAKVFPVRDNVWATVELFCSPPDSFKAVFQRSMGALQSVVGVFAEKMRQ